MAQSTAASLMGMMAMCSLVICEVQIPEQGASHRQTRKGGKQHKKTPSTSYLRAAATGLFLCTRSAEASHQKASIASHLQCYSYSNFLGIKSD